MWIRQRKRFVYFLQSFADLCSFAVSGKSQGVTLADDRRLNWEDHDRIHAEREEFADQDAFNRKQLDTLDTLSGFVRRLDLQLKESEGLGVILNDNTKQMIWELMRNSLESTDSLFGMLDCELCLVALSNCIFDVLQNLMAALHAPLPATYQHRTTTSPNQQRSRLTVEAAHRMNCSHPESLY